MDIRVRVPSLVPTNMNTYLDTLKHIKRNSHQYITSDVFQTNAKLVAKLDVVSFIYNKSSIDVTNDFADLA